MSGSDVPFFEMDDKPLTDSNIEAVLSGDQTTGPSELHALFGGLRERFESSADVPVGAALAEFIDIVDLTTTASETAGTTRKRKMITGIGTFIATTTGKVVLGATVAAASVGGVHAADLVDVPGLPNESAEVIVVDESELLEDVAPIDTEEETDAVVDSAEESADAANDDESEDGDDESEDEKNHGQIVSDFAHTTELEGCEKGQAISALASSKADDKRQNDRDDDDGEAADDGDAAADEDELDDSKCKDKGDDAEDDADKDDDAEDDADKDDDAEDDDDNGKGNNNGNGKAKGKDKKESSSDDDSGAEGDED